MDAGEGFEGREGELALSGWQSARHVIVLRRRLKGEVVLSEETHQLALGFVGSDVATQRYEYFVLVTSLPHEIRALILTALCMKLLLQARIRGCDGQSRRSAFRYTVGDWRPSFRRLSQSEEQRGRHRRRRRSQSPGLRVPVSLRVCALSRRTFTNHAG